MVKTLKNIEFFSALFLAAVAELYYFDTQIKLRLSNVIDGLTVVDR
jgi:hypothetical protein